MSKEFFVPHAASGAVSARTQWLEAGAVQMRPRGASCTEAAPCPDDVVDDGEQGRQDKKHNSGNNNNKLRHCQVPGCKADLAKARSYYQRYRICHQHSQRLSQVINGETCRFCQGCGRFHKVEMFEGTRRSCRNQLEKHNARRRKRVGDKDPAEEDGPPRKLAAERAAARGAPSATSLRTTSSSDDYLPRPGAVPGPRSDDDDGSGSGDAAPQPRKGRRRAEQAQEDSAGCATHDSRSTEPAQGWELAPEMNGSAMLLSSASLDAQGNAAAAPRRSDLGDLAQQALDSAFSGDLSWYAASLGLPEGAERQLIWQLQQEAEDAEVEVLLHQLHQQQQQRMQQQLAASGMHISPANLYDAALTINPQTWPRGARGSFGVGAACQLINRSMSGEVFIGGPRRSSGTGSGPLLQLPPSWDRRVISDPGTLGAAASQRQQLTDLLGTSGMSLRQGAPSPRDGSSQGQPSRMMPPPPPPPFHWPPPPQWRPLQRAQPPAGAPASPSSYASIHQAFRPQVQSALLRDMVAASDAAAYGMDAAGIGAMDDDGQVGRAPATGAARGGGGGSGVPVLDLESLPAWPATRKQRHQALSMSMQAGGGGGSAPWLQPGGSTMDAMALNLGVGAVEGHGLVGPSHTAGW